MPPLVLAYHGISDSWPSPLAVPAADLAAQVAGLLRRGYDPMTFSEAMRRPRERVLAVTFDDAYRSVHRRALPVLERLGVPGSVFVPTGWVGAEEPMRWAGIEEWAGGGHAAELVPMGWVELRALADRGWEVGSHTVTHPRLPELGDDGLREELEASRRACEAELERPCRAVAYPYGACDARVARAAAIAGYSCGAALPESRVRRHRHAWHRIGVYRGESRLRLGLKTAAPPSLVPALSRLGRLR